MNVDIFTCIHFCAVPKNWQFRADLFSLCGIIKVIFTMYIFSRIFDKRENMYSAKISTFTVYCFEYIFSFT